jgi:plasmid stabilization system protein ParE
MKINFSQNALLNLDDIATYIYKQSKSKTITAQHIRTLRKYIRISLSEFPKIGRPAEEFGEHIRKLVFQRYSILYIIEENHINIIAIYKQNLPSL